MGNKNFQLNEQTWIQLHQFTFKSKRNSFLNVGKNHSYSLGNSSSLGRNISNFITYSLLISLRWFLYIFRYEKKIFFIVWL